MTTERKVPEMGKIEKVDIKGIWQTENNDFTPWLFENISELGNALGLDLEPREKESPVGKYRLDVLAEVGGHPVVIENQYGWSDHDHLGKLLTYAAGFDATKVIVWIAEHFEEEHLAALELLNNRSEEEDTEFPEFFGVKIEAWKIGDSPVAPRFDVVTAPNGWTEDNKTRRQVIVSERGEKYREFFQPLVDTLKYDHNLHNRTNATGRWWESFSASHSGLSYRSGFFTHGGKRHRTVLYIDRGDKSENEEIFNTLHAQKQDIESALGESHTWDWQRLDHRRACRISIVRDGGIDDEDKHDDIRKWMGNHLLKFREVFGPRLVELAEQGIL